MLIVLPINGMDHQTNRCAFDLLFLLTIGFKSFHRNSILHVFHPSDSNLEHSLRRSGWNRLRTPQRHGIVRISEDPGRRSGHDRCFESQSPAPLSQSTRRYAKMHGGLRSGYQHGPSPEHSVGQRRWQQGNPNDGCCDHGFFQRRSSCHFVPSPIPQTT